jgi:hypothetical protein
LSPLPADEPSQLREGVKAGVVGIVSVLAGSIAISILALVILALLAQYWISH